MAGLVIMLPAAYAEKKETVSKLSEVGVETKKDDIVVTVVGSRAPDFTSFTMSDPFRVVVDWAGSQLAGAKDRTFERGLIRAVRTKQFDSEAEKISRITIELSRETAYHVEADGTKVSIHFEPVADPIPEKPPEPVKEQAEEKTVAYVPEGPLTEPDLPIPDAPPAPPEEKKIEVALVAPKKPAPVKTVPVKMTPKPEPQKVEVAKVKPVPKPAPVVAVKKVEPKPQPKIDPKKVEPIVVAEERPTPEKKAAVVTAPVEKTPAPVVAKVEPKPVEVKAAPVAVKKAEPKKAEPKQLATFTPKTQPVKTQPKVENLRVTSPIPKPVRRNNTRTRQLASNVPKPAKSGWTPPTAGKRRSLPVVKVKKAVGQETLEPTGETAVDPDAASDSSMAGDDDFDPGPRVMKYIGFRQMAGVSRVFVRLDGKAKYKSYKSGGSFVLELVNTSVPVKNNTRPLDTSYFNTSVTNVQAVPSGSNTRIEIKLKESVPAKVKRIGTTIAIDFTR